MSETRDGPRRPERRNDATERALRVVRGQLAEAISRPKCHPCGCFRSAVTGLLRAEPAQRELAEPLSAARAAFAPQAYDCLGCPTCYPAAAAEAFLDAFPASAGALALCPTEAPDSRAGWPPLPGDYRVLRYRAPIAVCVLGSDELFLALSRAAPRGVSIVGTMRTENLGIERVIRNVSANPNIRFLLLCGRDASRAVGHLPGQSLVSLFRNGLDARGRIVGAKGKRPLLKNVTAERVGAFLRQIELVDLVGETSLELVLSRAGELAARQPPPFGEAVASETLAPIATAEPKRLVADPGGFFVVYPDRGRRRLVLEHFTNAGVLDCVLEGTTPSALYAEAIARSLLSRLDHAAYLGQELARAEASLVTGAPYVQDRAAGQLLPDSEAAGGEGPSGRCCNSCQAGGPPGRPETA